MKLSNREKEVLQYVAVLCLSNKEAARAMGISARTIEDHRANIMKKMGARNIAEVARMIALGEAHGSPNKMSMRPIPRPDGTQEIGTAIP